MAEYLADLKNSVDHNERLLKDIEHGLAQLGDLKKREIELDETERKVQGKLDQLAAIRSSWEKYETTL